MSTRQEPDGHWSIAGVYVGTKLTDTLYAEPTASRRYTIRSTLRDATFAVRLGEVFGGGGDYQACLMRGDHVGNARSLLAAAKMLEANEYRQADA